MSINFSASQPRFPSTDPLRGGRTQFNNARVDEFAKKEGLTSRIGLARRYVAMATSSYTNFSGSVTSGQTYRNIHIAETWSAKITAVVRTRSTATHLHHGFVLLLQLLVGDAVLFHWQQRQGAAKLAALVLHGPAHQLRQQVRGEPGRVRVRHAIGEPGIWGQNVEL